MHIWLVEALWLHGFCKKLIFPYNKGISFYLTIMVVVTLENGTPISIPIKSNYRPNKLI